MVALDRRERRIAGDLLRPRPVRVDLPGLFSGRAHAALACITRGCERPIRIIGGPSNEILQALLDREQLTQSIIDVIGLCRRNLRHQRYRPLRLGCRKYTVQFVVAMGKQARNCKGGTIIGAAESVEVAGSWPFRTGVAAGPAPQGEIWYEPPAVRTQASMPDCCSTTSAFASEVCGDGDSAGN